MTEQTPKKKTVHGEIVKQCRCASNLEKPKRYVPCPPKCPTFRITPAMLFEIRLPMLPNFLPTEKEGLRVDVADMSEHDIRLLGKQWTEAMIEHSRKRREAKRG